MKRKIVQTVSLLASNGYIQGFLKGRIYKGKLKHICVPGLNCYSCPGAVGSCPIGSLQASLSNYGHKISMYVLGFIILTGSILGRFVCGWLCPFGLIQDLLHKIPSHKIRTPKKLYWLKYVKYIVLVVFVLILPILLTNEFGLGKPAFCKYICPAGTLEGGIPFVLFNKSFHIGIGWLFRWKLLILISVAAFSIIMFRPFCRFICPLGAIYSLFNPISLYRMEVAQNKCTGCSACAKKCKLDIDVYKNPNSPECIRCGQCISICPSRAISTKLGFSTEIVDHKVNSNI